MFIQALRIKYPETVPIGWNIRILRKPGYSTQDKFEWQQPVQLEQWKPKLFYCSFSIHYSVFLLHPKAYYAPWVENQYVYRIFLKEIVTHRFLSVARTLYFYSRARIFPARHFCRHFHTQPIFLCVVSRQQENCKIYWLWISSRAKVLMNALIFIVDGSGSSGTKGLGTSLGPRLLSRLAPSFNASLWHRSLIEFLLDEDAAVVCILLPRQDSF